MATNVGELRKEKGGKLARTQKYIRSWLIPGYEEQADVKSRLVSFRAKAKDYSKQSSSLGAMRNAEIRV